MPANYSDYLLVGGVLGQWVGLVNNATSTAYKATAATNAQGLFTVANIPGGTYTVYTSLTGAGSPPGAGWVATGEVNYTVPITPTDAVGVNTDLAIRSLTVLPNGPYTSSFPAGSTNPLTSGSVGPVYDQGGELIHVSGPKYRALGTWDPIAGTGDAITAINQAITDAGTNGVLLFGYNHTYLCSGVLSPLQGQTWKGPNATIKKKTNVNQAIIQIAAGLTAITIRDLLLDGDAHNLGGGGVGINILNQSNATPTQDIALVDVKVLRCQGNGFTIRGVDIQIQGCRAEDCCIAAGSGGFGVIDSETDVTNPATGITTKDVRFVRCVSRNHTTQASSIGYYIYGKAKSGWGTTIRDIFYVNCHAENIGTQGVGGGAGWAIQSTNLVGAESGVRNNIGIVDVALVGCTSFKAADVQYYTQGCQSVTIDSCTADGNAGGSGITSVGYGIEIQATQETSVTGCTVRNCSGNTGIISHGGTTALFNVASVGHVISSCVISGCNAGIELKQEDDAYPDTAIRVVGNSVRRNNSHGLLITVVSGWIVSDNILQDNALTTAFGKGIALTGVGVQQQLANGTINNNVFRDTRSGGSRTQLIGMQDNSTNVDSLMIQGNIFVNMATANIVLGGVANQIRNNQGYNPLLVTTPAVSTPLTNTFGVDIYVSFIANAAGTTFTVAGKALGATPANAQSGFLWPATSVMSYVNAPASWAFIGQ